MTSNHPWLNAANIPFTGDSQLNLIILGKSWSLVRGRIEVLIVVAVELCAAIMTHLQINTNYNLKLKVIKFIK